MLGMNCIKIAVVYMMVGAGLGLTMGISADFALSSVHSHILLLGWATMAICGILYLVLPGCARTRLATIHFWSHNLGLPAMMASLTLKGLGHDAAEPAIGISSTVVFISLLLFAVNLFRTASTAVSETPVAGRAAGR